MNLLHSFRHSEFRASGRRISLLIAIMLVTTTLSAQYAPQPKLVVGIVVDQMRTDYIYRYWSKYEEDGLKRLINEGYFCRNAHFNYAPTYTGPGHASIYTGATPLAHGIIANSWYDKANNTGVYCASDPDVESVGTDNSSGQMSPHRMLAPSLGDAIRTNSQFKGKSIGLSIKDRSAIFPAGHSANGAYWMDKKTGRMVTSSYYTSELPKWVKQFNAQKLPDEMAKEPWTMSLALSHYKESTPDNTPYEGAVSDNGNQQFPHGVAEHAKEGDYSPFTITPYGNTLVRKFAEAAIIGEDLGADEHTDLLAISFSSTDMIGHAFGPQSIEIQDTYLRLDREIAQLLKALDERIGAGEYVVFLTADHGAAQVPQYLMDNQIPAGYLSSSDFKKQLKVHLAETFGDSLVLSYSNQQVFLDHDAIEKLQLGQFRVYDSVKKFALGYEGVANALSANDLRLASTYDHHAKLAIMGWNPLRSGDVMIQYLPGWMSYRKTGTTHGTTYNYDTHVPVLFYGFGVPQGSSTEVVDITQIVPTISMICNIALPDAADQRVIQMER